MGGEVGKWVGVGGTFGVGVGRKIREKTAHLFLNKSWMSPSNRRGPLCIAQPAQPIATVRPWLGADIGKVFAMS